MNPTDPVVSHQNDAAKQQLEDGDWNTQSVPAAEQPVLMAGIHREIFYDAREVYGGY